MAKHHELTEPNAIHPAAFVGATDPALTATNNVTAEKLWIDTTLPAPYLLKKRDATNTFWEVVGGGTGGSSSFGASSGPPPFEHEEPEMPWINPGGGSVSGGGTSQPNYACRIKRTSNEAVTDNTAYAINFDTEEFDTDNMVDIAGNPTRITFTHAGVYVIDFGLAFANNAASYRALRIRLDGSLGIAEVHLQPNGGLNDHLHVTTVYKVTAGQYAEFIAIQNTGGNLNALSGNDWTIRAAAAYLCAG